MSSLEVIEQIKALPPDEKARVVDFVRQMEAAAPLAGKSIRYATPEQVEAVGEKVIRQYGEVFRRLAR
ncbi:MAG: hypothetical protein HY735_16225 [Verrucomicrobia bacterium]|nr:hypothetical protein [Verrucomicrobiota bacterium]